ncbi:carbohydrate ABC transporter membrane protein 1, CUT1 family [Ruania alba]|uniref:Carbohydrate ABC transporter membrane protein 1, CUT1 family n=2 Tax=Ruania alba TaxID=648782 RepID=A0A1H5ET87_9MICO|nr:carbohydrate ABC transporter membrane protein 1, CUT1 family [Ruania alba]
MAEQMLAPARTAATRRDRRDLVGLVYVAPVMLVLLVVLILPALFAVFYSLLELQSVRPVGFAGLDNYRRVFSDPQMVDVLLRTLGFAVVTVALTLAVALAVAVFLDRLTTGRATLVQILVILPWVISTIVGALLFRWFFVTDISPGVYLLSQLGIHVKPLTDPTLSMVTLVLVATWRTLGFAVLLLLAGIKAVPAEFYEAATVDGASSRQQFRLITLPMIKTSLTITTVVLTMSNLNNVEAPLVTTGGGPGDATQILPLTIYQQAFTHFDFAGGAALAAVALVLNVGLVFVYLRLARWSV